MWTFQVVKDDGGGWRWQLVLHNTLIAFESAESFTRRSDARQAAEIARAEIGAATVIP